MASTSPSFRLRRRYAAAALLGAGAMLPVLAAAPAGAADPESVTFTYTGQAAGWEVPTGVQCVSFQVVGARGGNGADYLPGFGAAGGAGAKVTVDLQVTAGSVLDIFVGGRGQDGQAGEITAPVGAGPEAVYGIAAVGGTGGADNGGAGGSGEGSGGGGGGGASAIGQGGGVLVVAGAGGGGGAGGPGGDGGVGGVAGQNGTAGGDTVTSEGEFVSYGTGGGGATQAAPGAAGVAIVEDTPPLTPSAPGVGDLGGEGGSNGDGGGGGGGGWFGGGGGYAGYGTSGAGGGAGSSFGPDGATFAAGAATPDGNGVITATWTTGPTCPSSTPTTPVVVQAAAVEPTFTG